MSCIKGVSLNKGYKTCPNSCLTMLAKSGPLAAYIVAFTTAEVPASPNICDISAKVTIVVPG